MQVLYAANAVTEESALSCHWETGKAKQVMKLKSEHQLRISLRYTGVKHDAKVFCFMCIFYFKEV